VSGYYKTEAVVLRSLRLREADRIVHLYTATRGRLGAVVKGVRRTRSRFGGRLEPLQRVRLVLYEGRGDLDTVTQVQAVEWYPRLRANGAGLHYAGLACESVLKLFGEGEANRSAYNLLCHELQLLDCEPGAAGPSNLLAFRLKALRESGRWLFRQRRRCALPALRCVGEHRTIGGCACVHDDGACLSVERDARG
jgi:DNA repair protein RecO (recombination protein O)